MLQASKLDLAAECLWPWVSGLKWDRSQSDYAYYGETGHAFAQEYVNRYYRAPDPVLASVIAKRFELDDSDTKRLATHAQYIAELIDPAIGNWAAYDTEVNLAYNPESGEVYKLKGDERRKGGFMLLKIDLLFTPNGGPPTVRDWKFGRRPLIRRVEDSLQVACYAAAVARWLSVSHVRVELAWVGDSGIWIDWAELGDMELDAAEEKVRQLNRDRQSVGSDYVPHYGLHCKEYYCPVIADCPAAKASVASADLAVSHGRGLDTTVVDHDHALEIMERLPLARARLDAVENAVREWSRKHGAIDAGDGRAFGWVQHDGAERIDATDESITALHRTLGESAREAITTKTSVTKTAIDRAIRERCTGRPRGAAKAMREALYADLRAVGAMKQGAPYEKFEAFDKTKAQEQPANGVDQDGTG